MSADTNRKHGDCDCCTNVNVPVTASNGMMMCDSCIALQNAAIERQKAVETIEKSVKTDDSIVMKTDLFNAATVSFIELQAAISHDSNIPEEAKGYELVKQAAERIKKMNAAIIADEQALMQKKNERHAWLTNVQEVASKLRADYREKFRQFDLSYQPVAAPKPTTKKAASKPKKETFKRADIVAACAKYNVADQLHMIQMMLVSRNGLTPEDAAKEWAGKLGRA